MHSPRERRARVCASPSQSASFTDVLTSLFLGRAAMKEALASARCARRYARTGRRPMTICWKEAVKIVQTEKSVSGLKGDSRSPVHARRRGDDSRPSSDGPLFVVSAPSLRGRERNNKRVLRGRRESGRLPGGRRVISCVRTTPEAAPTGGGGLKSPRSIGVRSPFHATRRPLPGTREPGRFSINRERIPVVESVSHAPGQGGGRAF